jgi:Asp/Glu/hydantoin racemase
MKNHSPRIGLVHAVQVAMAPVEAAFRERWPDAERMNVFDDALVPDLERAGELTDGLSARIALLADYCADSGCAAVLFTCSSFGAAVEAKARAARVPVLKPNEAMFEQALALGARIGMLTTFPPAAAPMEAEFRAEAKRRGVAATIETHCVPEALAAAKSGDYERHNRLLREAAARFAGFDALLLAQFSMAPALREVQKALAIPALSSPHAAVEKLKSILASMTLP